MRKIDNPIIKDGERFLMKTLKQNGIAQKGQSLIEFAVIISLMFIILAGIVDLGRAFLMYINLRDAVEEGAIYGSIQPTDCDGISARTLDNVNNASGVTVEILISGVDCATAALSPETYSILGNEVRVTATLADFPLTMPFLGTVLGSQTINLTSTMTGTILRPLVIATPVPTPTPSS